MKPVRSSSIKKNNTSQSAADFFFDLVSSHSSTIKNTLATDGDTTIDRYTRQYPLPLGNGCQEKDDFYDVVYDYLLPIHGENIARRTVIDLSKTPVALTANHHGVDFFAQSVQGTLLFSLILTARNSTQSTIPVIACANVPLNNLTFPRGLLLYHTARDTCKGLPRKIPVFSDKFKTSFVSLAGPIDKDMVKRAVQRTGKLVSQGELLPAYGAVLKDIFDKEYAQTVAQGWKGYSEQAVVLNHRLWNRMFADPNKDKALDLVYMDLEAIVSRLLVKDLQDPTALIYRVMFDPDIAENVISKLDGAPACWQKDKLGRRLVEDCSDREVKKALGNCGTHFFWGVGAKNKLVPMMLAGRRSGTMELKGKDDYGQVYTIAFDPETVTDALAQGHLMPSLFTCYTSLSLARGMGCIGGYYQSEYLPGMQNAVISALSKKAGMKTICEQVQSLHTGNYLSGMQAVMTKVGDDGLIPAGPVEIIAAGGLKQDDLARLKQLTIKEAHLASLCETIPDIVPFSKRTDGWDQEISVCCRKLLGEKIPLV